MPCRDRALSTASRIYIGKTTNLAERTLFKPLLLRPRGHLWFVPGAGNHSIELVAYFTFGFRLRPLTSLSTVHVSVAVLARGVLSTLRHSSGLVDNTSLLVLSIGGVLLLLLHQVTQSSLIGLLVEQLSSWPLALGVHGERQDFVRGILQQCLFRLDSFAPLLFQLQRSATLDGELNDRSAIVSEDFLVIVQEFDESQGDFVACDIDETEA